MEIDEYLRKVIAERDAACAEADELRAEVDELRAALSEAQKQADDWRKVASHNVSVRAIRDRISCE